MGSVRETYKPSGPWIDFKGYREGSFRRCEHQDVLAHFKVKPLHPHLQVQGSGVLSSLSCQRQEGTFELS